MTVFALWDSIRYRQFAVLATGISVLFAPMLTIVVSGLYYPQNVPFTHSAIAQQLTWFNSSSLDLSFINTKDDYLQRVVTELVVFGNLSYPEWTYDEVALPKIAIQPVDGIGGGKNYLKDATSFNARLPAVRGIMNCTTVPIERILNTEMLGKYLMLNISSAEYCGDNYPWLTIVNINTSATGYFGELYSNGPNDCPSIYTYFGHVTQGKQTVDNLTILYCSPFVQQLEVNTTVILPDLRIDTSHPPIADESTVVFFSNQTYDFLDVEFQGFTFNFSDEQHDEFFTALIFGKFGVPAAELLDPHTLINASEHLYRIIMAQVFNTAFRINLTSTTLNGTYTNPYRARMQQSAISTRLLQALLALLFFCAVAAYVFMDPRNVLPKNPYTIAAVGSLLAGSELLRLVPPGAEWWDDKEMSRRGFFEEWVYSLGWWENGVEGRKRRFGIDIRKAQKVS